MAETLFGTASSAVMDETGRYRYQLLRVWDEALPRVCFVMLNPSTADHTNNDPTITRCLGFARAWGYGSLEVVNLFALRATDPQELRRNCWPIAPRNDQMTNDQFVVEATVRAKITVIAWGTQGGYMGRHSLVLPMLERVHCLATTKAGFPRHPLYMKSDTEPVRYR